MTMGAKGERVEKAEGRRWLSQPGRTSAPLPARAEPPPRCAPSSLSASCCAASRKLEWGESRSHGTPPQERGL